VLLLGEHGSAGQALTDYARIVYQARIGARAEALALCRASLAGWPDAPLAPELRLEEIRLLAAGKDWAAADSALAGLIAGYPRARATGKAMLVLGEMGLDDPARTVLARDYLEQLVLTRPDSYEARRARGLLAELRKADVDS
jgi:hypothetical protein